MEEALGGGVALGDILDGLNVEREIRIEQAIDKAKLEVGKTVPLFVVDAERNVLGSILIDPVNVMPKMEEVGLVSGDFYNRRHEQIYDVMVSMYEDKTDITTITVADELNRRALLEVIGMSYLSMLSSDLPSTAMAGVNAKVVIEKARLRLVAEACADGLAMSRQGCAPHDIIDGLQEALETAGRSSQGKVWSDLRSCAKKALSALPALGGVVRGESTGFPDVDRLFRLRDGELVIVGGRPSMGKTQWALDVMRFISIKNHMPSCMFSLEMDDQQLMTRLIGAESGVDVDKFRMNQSESDRVALAAGLIAESPIKIDDTPCLSIGELRAKARRAHREKSLALLVIDYLQLVDPTRRSDNRAQELGEVSKGLKSIGRELKCPVIALCQLNRGVEARTNKRPMISDLRESGNIEQDADVIAFLYREEYYAKDRTPEELIGVAELIVGKNRNGPTGQANLLFQKEIPRFVSMSEAA